MILRPEQDGQRLDVYLAETVEGLSRSAAQKLIAGGALTLDGQSVRKMDKTIAGREYALEIPEAKPVAIEAHVQVVEQVLYDLAKGQGHDGQVVSVQAHDRKADDPTSYGGKHAGNRDGDEQAQGIRRYDSAQA